MLACFPSSVSAPRKDSGAEWSDATSPDWAPAPLLVTERRGSSTPAFSPRVSVGVLRIFEKKKKKIYYMVAIENVEFVHSTGSSYLFAFATYT